MKVIFPNSAWVTTYERLVLRGGRSTKVRFKVRYGIIIHPTHGPILIDTGFTPETTSAPGRSAILKLYANILKPDLIEEEQPRVMLEKLGFGVEDVKFVIVTHFHADHISGLKQFPNARFIANDAAFRQIQNASPSTNIRHAIFTELLPEDFASRLIGTSTLRQTAVMKEQVSAVDLLGDGRVLAVDLPGHAIGHFGLLVNGGDKPLFYAVDTQWHLQAISENRIPGWPARIIATNREAWHRSTQFVATALNDDCDVVLCHHPEEGPFDFPTEAGRACWT